MREKKEMMESEGIKMRDILKGIIKGIIVLILFSLLFLFVALLYGIYEANDNTLWNDGHCDICGGTWEYEQAVGHSTSTSYIYVCRNCGKRIEIRELKCDKTESEVEE